MGHHGHGHGHHHDPFADPAALQAWLEKLEGPERAEWQRPDDVVAALKLSPGSVVCEVGAGPGYFTLRLARAVGATGRVHAIELEPRVLEILRHRLREAHVRNVHPLLSTNGLGLPPEPVDRVLIVNTFHHFEQGVAYLRALRGNLRPGGTIVNVDFQAGELPFGPPPEMRISREAFLELAAEAGLSLVEEHEFLPYQYFVALR